MRTIWRIRADLRNQGYDFLIRFRWPWISVITRRIGTRTGRIVDGNLTRTRNFLMSQFLMMISPISSDLSLSCAQLYHHLGRQSEVIPPYLFMPWSWLNTEYSIHQVQHHRKIDSLPLPASFPLPARVSAAVTPPPKSTASKYSSNLTRS